MIAEPMTLLTDYVLAGVTGWLAWRLLRVRAGQAARSCWALAFAAVALGAALGGSYHGFAGALDPGVLQLVWNATVLAVGLGGFAMVAGSAIAVTAGRSRQLLLGLAVVQFVVYAALALGRDDFIYVIADTGVAMAFVAALHGWSALDRRDRGSFWILGGVGVSLLAAGVQASGFDLHPGFNHNDLYHVIQIGAMLLFYGGARRSRDHA